jgi:hypothetical protein
MKAARGVEVRFQIRCPANTANRRMHWAARHRLFRRVREEVWEALLATNALPSPNAILTLAKSPAKKLVSFVRYYGGRLREMDHDGFACATKPVLDALKCSDRGFGLIFDDAPRWCAVTWEQVKDKDRAGMLDVTVQNKFSACPRPTCQSRHWKEGSVVRTKRRRAK